MKKKLLTAAVGAALAAVPALYAQADVKVYGMLQVELASEDADLALAGTSEEFLRTSDWDGGDLDTANDGSTGSMLTLEDNQRGRFGIKADEDLGGGLKGLAVVEYDIGDNTDGGGPAIRHASVGLSGAFGTLSVGRLKSPYKYTGGVKYDPFVTTNLEARRNGGMTGGPFGHNSFLDNMISYQTPKDLPVSIWVAYSPDENGTDTEGNSGKSSTATVVSGCSDTDNDGELNTCTNTTVAGTKDHLGAAGDKGDYAVSVMFGQKNWEVFVARANNQDNTGPADSFANDFVANKIGGKFSIGPHTILAQYEDTDEDISSGVSQEGKLLFVGYHFKMGNTTLVAQLGDGELEQTGNPNTQEHTYLTLGAVHNLSKTTRLFGGYSTTEVDNEGFAAGVNGERKVFSIGLRKDF